MSDVGSFSESAGTFATEVPMCILTTQTPGFLSFHMQTLHYWNLLWNPLVPALKWILNQFSDKLQLLLNFNCFLPSAMALRRLLENAGKKSRFAQLILSASHRGFHAVQLMECEQNIIEWF